MKSVYDLLERAALFSAAAMQNCVTRLLRLANWALERQLQNGVEL
jgi:hypothetical protein